MDRLDQGDVRAIALTVSEATRSTKHRRAPTDWDLPAARDPWFLVGWVVLQRDWGFTDGWGWERYDRAWDVWLNADDGRVWLKLSRLGRRPTDDRTTRTPEAGRGNFCDDDFGTASGTGQSARRESGATGVSPPPR